MHNQAVAKKIEAKGERPLNGFGRRFRQALARRGMTRSAFLRAHGQIPMTVYRYEVGETSKIPADVVTEFAEALEVSSDWLAFGIGPMEPLRDISQDDPHQRAVKLDFAERNADMYAPEHLQEMLDSHYHGRLDDEYLHDILMGMQRRDRRGGDDEPLRKKRRPGRRDLPQG